MNAWYSVLRYTPDIVRNEPANVGLVGFYEGRIHVTVDDAAVQRMLSMNPGLPPDALRYIEDVVREVLDGTHPRSAEELETLLSTRIPFPIAATPPRPFTIQPNLHSSFDRALPDELERLSLLMVHPKRRDSKPRVQSAREVIKKELGPLIRSEQVEENYSVVGGKSGTARRLDFYANHGSNVALEIADLPPAPGYEALKSRADALAYGAEDILASSTGVNSLVIYVPADRRRNLQDFDSMARDRLRDLQNVAIIDLASAAIERFLSEAKIDPEKS